MLSDALPVITSCKKRTQTKRGLPGVPEALFSFAEKKGQSSWLGCKAAAKPVYPPARVSLAIFHTDLHTLLGFLPLQGYVILRKKG